jgi:hypothetical protein
MTTVVSVAQGGTGSNSAALARTALGVPPSAAYDQANTARDQANSAYSDANTRLSASGGTLAGDLIITGNLTVSGNSTTLNTEILTVEDADIVLLSNVASTPALNAGIIVNRGTSTNTFLRWDEVTDKWGWSDDGSTTYKFNSALDAYAQANSAYGAANNRVLKAGDTMTGQLNISAGGLLVTGNVGIGITNPDSYGKFVVSGTGYVSHFNATSGAVGFGLYENGTGRFYIKTLNGSDGLAFIDGDGTSERMRITGEGSLLVNTTTDPTSGGFPKPPLSIKQFTQDSVGFTGIHIEAANDQSVLGIGYDGTHFDFDTSYRITGAYRGISFSTVGSKRLIIDVGGDITPGANGTQNLGSTTARWATVFTSDLDLNNGVGDWTIVEGEDDLFIYNNKRGKVYKFKLEEVDPSTATPKKDN